MPPTPRSANRRPRRRGSRDRGSPLDDRLACCGAAARSAAAVRTSRARGHAGERTRPRGAPRDGRVNRPTAALTSRRPRPSAWATTFDTPSKGAVVRSGAPRDDEPDGHARSSPGARAGPGGHLHLGTRPTIPRHRRRRRAGRASIRPTVLWDETIGARRCDGAGAPPRRPACASPTSSGDACANVLVYNARPPARAPQRGRHREGAVAGVPRRGIAAPLRHGPRAAVDQSPTRAARHDAFCGASTSARNDGEVRERRRARRASQRPRPVRGGAGEARARPPRHRAERQLLQGRARRRPTARLRFDGDPVESRRATWSCAPSCPCSSSIANTPHVLDPATRVLGHPAADHRVDRHRRRRAPIRAWSRRPKASARSCNTEELVRSDPRVGDGLAMTARRCCSTRCVDARAPWARVVEPRLRRCRSSTSSGNQAVDCLLYNADDPAERYSAPDTIVAQGNIFLVAGIAAALQRGPPDDDPHRDHVRAPRHHRRRVQPGVEHAALRLPHQAPARVRRELPARALVAGHGQARHDAATSTGS